MKTYKQFLETQDDAISPSEAQKKYENYTKEYAQRNSRRYFHDHRNEEWFREKYDPEYLERKRIRKMDTLRTRFTNFLQDLSAVGAVKYNLDCSKIVTGSTVEEPSISEIRKHDVKGPPEESVQNRENDIEFG